MCPFANVFRSRIKVEREILLCIRPVNRRIKRNDSRDLRPKTQDYLNTASFRSNTLFFRIPKSQEQYRGFTILDFRSTI